MTISPLRRRLIEDMTIRRLSPNTQHHYIRHVKSFADFLGRPPDKTRQDSLDLHIALGVEPDPLELRTGDGRPVLERRRQSSMAPSFRGDRQDTASGSAAVSTWLRPPPGWR